MKNSRSKIDTPGELADLFAYLITFIIVGMFLGGIALSAYPSIDDRVRANYLSDKPVQSGEKIVFQGEQINLVSKAYREKNEEIGFCLSIDGNRVESMKFSLNVTHSDAKSWSGKCQVGANGLIHTHPGYFSSPELSEVDKDVLRSGGMDVVCALSESVPVNVGRNPVMMRCLDSDLESLDIVIER